MGINATEAHKVLRFCDERATEVPTTGTTGLPKVCQVYATVLIFTLASITVFQFIV